ncbi:MAG: phospholipase D-like domain-containing protein [Rhodospirillales bacterium]
MTEATSSLWPALWAWLLTAAQMMVAVITSGHVILHKRDVRAAIGWVGLIWFVPFGGSVLYFLFGINRIRRRAHGLRGPRPAGRPVAMGPVAAVRLPALLPDTARHLAALGQLHDRINDAPLTEGNRIAAFTRGADAYAAMIAAIDAARRTIGLMTYIFDVDVSGRAFIEALERAQARGVRVRVLIDGVGARYTRPPVIRELSRRKVKAAEFLPTGFPLVMPYANLRNHRKILVIDGAVGFTGGMNIRHSHAAEDAPDAIADVHFRIDGPVVDHLVVTFLEDWLFAAGETLGGEWFQPPETNDDLLNPKGLGDAWHPTDDVAARGIAAGPDEAFERIRWTILAALALAERRVRIVTPYFVPDQTLMTALSLAALRGVAVDIIIPKKGNLRLVRWASRAKLSHLLASGCRVWLTPQPFDHAKLMTVDSAWALIGSSNWDARSLRLNFEFNVECYGEAMARAIDGLIELRIARAQALTFIESLALPLFTRLRDGTAWLASPYL